MLGNDEYSLNIVKPINYIDTFSKGLSIKDVRSQEEGLSSAGNFWTRGWGRKGVLQMRMSALYGEKTSNFSKFLVCPHKQGG